MDYCIRNSIYVTALMVFQGETIENNMLVRFVNNIQFSGIRNIMFFRFGCKYQNIVHVNITTELQ